MAKNQVNLESKSDALLLC